MATESTNSLRPEDAELIQMARQAIANNYDGVHYRQTVGAALRCQNGKVYLGVNLYAIFGACAETIALGAAITAGERDFDCIVAVGGEQSDQIYPPCGNCRQNLSEYAPDIQVILPGPNGPERRPIKALLPCAWRPDGQSESLEG